MITLEVPEHLAHIIIGLLMNYEKACIKHPKFANNGLEMCAILTEETGEVSKAVMEYLHGDGSINDIDQELYDTAAVCIRGLLLGKESEIINRIQP